jgi:hypothetical protein
MPPPPGTPGAGRDHRGFGLGDGFLPGVVGRAGPITGVDVLLARRLDGGGEPAARGDLPFRGQMQRGGGGEVPHTYDPENVFASAVPGLPVG